MKRYLVWFVGSMHRYGVNASGRNEAIAIFAPVKELSLAHIFNAVLLVKAIIISHTAALIWLSWVNCLLNGRKQAMAKTWRNVLDEMIAEQCKEAYRQANAGEKRYHPYSVPELAQAMVKALDKDDGYEGKRLMLIYRTGALSLV